MKRPGVNLMILWDEYCAVHPDGYGYSRFCDLFREFEQRLGESELVQEGADEMRDHGRLIIGDR